MPPTLFAPIVPVSPSQPQDDVLAKTAEVLRKGGVIAFPTDTLYGIGCLFGENEAIKRIQAMREFDITSRPLTFLLPDLGELPRYAIVTESSYSVLKKIFPGPYCAEVLAGPGVPAPFVQEDRRTIGVRIPGTAFCEKLLWSLAKPILSATAKSLSGDVLTSAAEIQRAYGKSLDLILDAGTLTGPPSTVVSLAGDWVTVVREGRGPSNKLMG